MRRFILLNYEPYLSIISEQKFVEPLIKEIIPSFFSRDNQDERFINGGGNNISLKELDLCKYIKGNYKYENIDYIENIILAKLNFNQKRGISIEDFIELFNKSLEFLNQSLFEGHKIKDLESFFI